MFGGRRQIEFPPQQTHVRSFEIGMLVFCLVSIVAVVIAVLTFDGAFIGPW